MRHAGRVAWAVAEAALKKRIAVAKAAIVRDRRRLSRTDVSVGWRTLDSIQTKPKHPMFGFSWRGADDIAKWIGPDPQGRPCSERTVWACWKRLVAYGYLVRKRRGGEGVTDLFSAPSDLINSSGQKDCLTGSVHPSDLINSSGNLTYDPPQEESEAVEVQSNLLGKETAEEREQVARGMRELIETHKARVDPAESGKAP